MKKLVSRIADIKLREVLDRDRGWSAILFFDFGSVPCEHFRPEFEMFARAMRAFYCAEIVCDENPTITSKCGVTAVPTTLILKGGKELGRYEGPYSYDSLKQRVADLLLKARE